MRIFIGLGLAVTVSAAIFLTPSAQVSAAQESECREASMFVVRQDDAGVPLSTYSREEIHWALRNLSAESCEPVPEALRARMRGEYPEPPHHRRMNCHIAVDYLMQESERDGRFITDEEWAWGGRYVEATGNGEPCPEVPQSLAIRAIGHQMGVADLKQSLATSMDVAKDGDAAMEIASAYFNGTMGVAKDAERGYAYLLAGAELGSPDAHWELANLYFTGKVDGKGPADALPHIERAAEGGVIDAMFRLARWYDEGVVVKVDPAAAFEWYGKAAERGSLQAAGIVADRLFVGQGVKKDRDTAFNMMRTAANAGDATAMTRIAYFMLLEEKPLAKEGEVWYWLDKARAAGNRTAIQFYEEKGDALERAFTRAKFPPPEVRKCGYVTKCDYYYYERRPVSICAPFPDWRACSYAQ